MNKNKFYLMIIISLLITNVLILFFTYPFHKRGFDPNKPRNIIIERLGFNQNQIVEYDKLIQVHRSKIREKDSTIKQLKNQLYLLLVSEDEDKKDSLIHEIANEQREIERIHFNHFMDIKNLCNPEQLIKFQELSKELSKILKPQPPKKP